jgi:lambda family phage portal protein
MGEAGGRVTARYENAVTTPENARNWIGADYLSAKSANSFGVRRTLRIRSRHEVSNNPFLFGIAHSNANDLIGDDGPTLQVRTTSAGYNRAVERCWQAWWGEVEGVEKLRTTKLAKTVDGEGFQVLKTVDDLEHPVKLFPCDLEADQVTTPAPVNLTDLWVDGIDLHPVSGRPKSYHVLKSHPGDFFFPNLNPLAVDKVPARWVIHWFQKSRPGQVRGVPTFTPSLDLFTELRAFRKAVLTNAQVAASFTALIESEAPAQNEPDVEYQPFKRVPINHGMMTMLPARTRMAGFDPKQPQTTYEMFQEKCLGEACRPLNYPLNLALGTSQKFNFSSSKLDHINYRNGLTVERGQCTRAVLEPMFRAWFEEAVLSGAIPVWEGGLNPPPHEWHWPGFESIDPLNDANADAAQLAGGQQTWQEFWARRGKDWKDVMNQQAIERDEIERLGITFGEPVKQTVSRTDEGDDTDPNKPAKAR